MGVHSSAFGTTYWLKYKSYIGIHSRHSTASEQMHRYLRCAFSETNCLTVFCLSLTAEVFLSGAAAVVNYSVSLQLIMAGENRNGKEWKRETDKLSLLFVVVCDIVWFPLNLELNSAELNQIESNQSEEN